MLVCIVIPYFFIYPDVGKDYSGFWSFWFGGLHGYAAGYLWIISLFDPTRLVIAQSHGTLYGVFYGIGIINFVVSTKKLLFRKVSAE